MSAENIEAQRIALNVDYVPSVESLEFAVRAIVGPKSNGRSTWVGQLEIPGCVKALVETSSVADTLSWMFSVHREALPGARFSVINYENQMPSLDAWRLSLETFVEPEHKETEGRTQEEQR